MSFKETEDILVVDIKQYASSESMHLAKASCALEVAPSSCQDIISLESASTSMNNINESLDLVHQQHMTHLQNVPFHEIQISFEQTIMNETEIPYQTGVAQALSLGQNYNPSYPPSLSPTEITVVEEKNSCINVTSQHLQDCSDSLRLPINDYNYYKEIEDYLKLNSPPSAASQLYNAHIKTRARHYLILNNELYHNPNKPKKVIMQKDDQTRILELSHVSKEGGIHIGIRRMMEMISGPYFWRGVYEDISNYVNSCPKCRDTVDIAQRLENENKLHLENFKEESEFSKNDLRINFGSQTSSNIWTNVEIQLHGPFKLTALKNELVITITDSASCFVHAAALPASNFSELLTDFVVKTFYTFGFPNSYMVIDEKLFETVSSEFHSKLKYSSWKTKLIRRENAECAWVGQLIDLMVRKKGEKWDTEIDKFMFQFRIGAIRDAFFTPTDSLPFYSMFSRSPYNVDKENFHRKIHKKKKFSIKCQKCDDIFTSKVKYRQHIKCHLLEESKNSKEKATSDEDALPFDAEENVSWAVEEIKSYLTETKDVRRKRGKYQRYSVEIQEHMICYALRNGAVKAADYFTQLMGSPVSDSTIRNLIRSSKQLQPRMKEDIARYALEHGIEETSQHFSKLLQKDISVKLVKRFKSIYGKGLKNKGQWVSGNNENTTFNNKCYYNLTDIEKEEIGKFSCENSIEDTIKHFRQKLDVVLNEENVFDCHKIYISNHPDTNNLEEPTQNENICPSHCIQLQNSCDYEFPDNFSQLRPPENHCAVTKVTIDSSLPNVFISQDCNTFHPENDHKEEVLNSPCNWKIKSSNDSDYNTNNLLNSDSENEESLDSPSSSSKIKPKSKFGKQKRGKYITYSPEMRAKIGKYAAENGSGKASKYFSNILGHELAESTARGLKDKYLKKIKQCDVTSLGYSPRGRPLRLGKYDELVQECLKEMVRSGEKLTAFLVIAIAKKIVSKLEPGLLKENGGTIILNKTWAKSFLKRICVRNNT